MKLLLLEDDPKVADFITKGLRELGLLSSIPLKVRLL